MSPASCEPGIELGAVVAGGAFREVVSGDPLPSGDLLERLNRLAPKVLGSLLRSHPFRRDAVLRRCLFCFAPRCGQIAVRKGAFGSETRSFSE
jgi:hypothetical protein